MGDIKQGEPFGLDPRVLDSLDWALATTRILEDLRSDFIYAPHLALIYARAGEELVQILKAELRAGKYSPGVPITIEVPKSFRMVVKVSSKRLGPSYSRPGSILLPRDRLFYQALADQAAPVINEKTDTNRSFSHRMAGADSSHMFVPTRITWDNLQKALQGYAKAREVQYILKIDVADFFGSINQHTLINTLQDAGYPQSLGSRLEAMLTAFTLQRSSRGILQGVFPSDLLGNFYLSPLDRYVGEAGHLSARYVDDMYIFASTVDDAERLLRGLIPELRSYDLVLNEAKSSIIPKSALVTEEPDLETLFENAVDEIRDHLDENDFDSDYGFQSEWEDEEEEDDEDDETEDEELNEDEALELAATKLLFDSIADYPGHEEKIERFCLPLFSKTQSDYAVDHVVDAFRKRPSMAQIYTSYLSNFLEEGNVVEALVGLLSDTSLVDWQHMWIVAALLKRKSASMDDAVRIAWGIANDPARHDALRAVAGIFVGRYGDAARRKALQGLYQRVSPYVQAAIYYSSRTWPTVERGNAKATWGSQSELNRFLTIAMSKQAVRLKK